MPTTGGPTNLPLYESFYFKKMIFYSEHLVHEKELSKNLITINIDEPDEFYKKITNLKDDEINQITENAFKFYKSRCSFENFKTTYLSIIEDFLDYKKKWK